MNKEVKELIDTLKEYADGFTNVLAPTEESVKALLDYINQLEKQLEHYKNKEIERINKDLMQVENDYLESCIKANIAGDFNG